MGLDITAYVSEKRNIRGDMKTVWVSAPVESFEGCYLIDKDEEWAGFRLTNKYRVFFNQLIGVRFNEHFDLTTEQVEQMLTELENITEENFNAVNGRLLMDPGIQNFAQYYGYDSYNLSMDEIKALITFFKVSLENNYLISIS